jgi:hypothetical protein
MGHHDFSSTDVLHCKECIMLFMAAVTAGVAAATQACASLLQVVPHRLCRLHIQGATVSTATVLEVLCMPLHNKYNQLYDEPMWLCQESQQAQNRMC